MRPGRVHAWMRCGAVAGVREDDCQCGLLTFQKGLRVGFPPHHSYSRLPRRAQITRGRHLGHPMPPRRADASGTRRLGHPMPRASVSTPPPSPPTAVATAAIAAAILASTLATTALSPAAVASPTIATASVAPTTLAAATVAPSTLTATALTSPPPRRRHPRLHPRHQDSAGAGRALLGSAATSGP